ncbi:ROK family protein [Alteromonas gracilis]|uniref:ROK family transcriptional regulator n=1 Tax=Alteromonas gracilis TaxID=1479524 RepID=UPI0037357620
MNTELAHALPSKESPTLLDNRSANERDILSLIRQHTALPKAEIAKLTRLSAQSATVIINKLEADGLVKRLTPIRGGAGQPKVPFGLNENGALSVGLKVGRRGFDMTLIDLAGTVRNAVHEKCAYPTVTNLLAFTQHAFTHLVEGLSNAQQQRIRGLGVAMPFEIWGWAEEAGAPLEELEKWKAFNPKHTFGHLLNLPVFMINDGGAACSGEMCFGNTNGYNSFLYLFVGTFLGGGLVINNQLINGKSGNAGAVGSLPFFNGSVQTQLIEQSSLYLLERKLNEAGLDGKQIYASPSHWLFDEQLVLDWVNDTAKGLAFAVHCASCLLDLEGVIIDGAIPQKTKRLLVDKTLNALTHLDGRGMAPVSVSEGHVGEKAQSIGSANLPLQANYY